MTPAIGVLFLIKKMKFINTNKNIDKKPVFGLSR